MSKKRAKLQPKYLKLRNIYLQANPDCEVKLKGCTGQSEDIHHSKGRGKNLLDVTTFIAVCRNCHDYIHFKMPKQEARERGFYDSIRHKAIECK